MSKWSNLIIASAVGVLLSHTTASPTYIQRRGISQDVLADLYLAHQYSAAAYCPNNNDSPDDRLSCPTGNCDIVQADRTVTLAEFEGQGIADGTGYVALDHTVSKIVIAFRGSESLENAIADIEFVPVPAPDVCDNCLAETGFYSFWKSSKTVVLNALAKARTEHPDYQVDVIGHSLGAAAATIAVAVIRNQGIDADLYSFSSPRVGDPVFARYVSDQDGVSGVNYRVTHLNDFVPKLPLNAMGFLHIANEYWITSPNGQNATASDFDVFHGYEGIDYIGGNAATLTTDFTFNTHEWIFDHITECYPKGTIEVTRRQAEIVNE